MNLMFLTSLLMLSLMAIAAAFMAVVFILDLRRSSHQNHLRKVMRAFVIENAMKSFSVITQTSGGAESVQPLVETLQQHKPSQLQLLVLVDSFADKQSFAELKRLQRQLKETLRIRIIRKKNNGNDKALIRRYSDGDALVWLNPTDLVTKEFFTLMSFELLDESCNAVAPRSALKVNDTLRSASGALHLIARQTIGVLSRQSITETLVVRRASYLNGETVRAVGAEHSTVTISTLQKYMAKVYIELVLVLAVAIVSAMSYIYLQYSWYIVTFAFIGILILLMLIRLISYPYSIWNKVSLALLIPIWPLVSIAIVILDGIGQAWAKLLARRIKPVEQT